MNHSIEFKDAVTGAHTNTIEELWYHAKLFCPSFNRKKDHFLGYLCTFILKKKWKEEEDSFNLFMQAAASLYSGKRKPLNPQDFEEDDEVVAEIVREFIVHFGNLLICYSFISNYSSILQISVLFYIWMSENILSVRPTGRRHIGTR